MLIIISLLTKNKFNLNFNGKKRKKGKKGIPG